MIKPSVHVNLGRDTSRMKNPADAKRQEATVREILRRMFDDIRGDRWEVQVLADEVGMGKTYIALATAFAVLERMRQSPAEPDLEGCASKVLVLVPSSGALLRKWVNEVGEFGKRCVLESASPELKATFSVLPIHRIDELPAALASRDGGVIVAPTELFRRKLLNYDLKRRFLLSVLFRYWSNSFPKDARERLLRGAPEGWPRSPEALGDFTPAERELLPFEPDDAKERLAEIGEQGTDISTLLTLCKEIAEPYYRGRDEAFPEVEGRLTGLYRQLALASVRADLPLVIVDEAHNWKNHANGYTEFVRDIAPRARRLLMLSATPFQLHPNEMLRVLQVADHLRPVRSNARARERIDRLRLHRQEVEHLLGQAASASKRFSHAWGSLPPSATTDRLANAWRSSKVGVARSELVRVALLPGRADVQVIDDVVERAVEELDPDVKELVREALRLHACNADLSAELGRFVIRHRRGSEHRLVRVGSEYRDDIEQVARRPDRQVLHAAKGLDVRGPAELPHYLLMRCVSEMKQGKGRASLGSDLTGCWSTLLHSAEGKRVHIALNANPTAAAYLEVLKTLVTPENDPEHPKMRAVTDAVVDAWRAGEKTLLFCFRTNTANRLRDILQERIRAELAEREAQCLGGPEALRSLRSRLTGRDRDLSPVTLDRVLWSWWWKDPKTAGYTPSDLALTDADLAAISEIAAAFDIDLGLDRVDRVFLHRATENVLARRLLAALPKGSRSRFMLEALADEAWIGAPQGVGAVASEDESAEHFDERGVHTLYSRGAVMGSRADIVERREKARRSDQTSVFDLYAGGPNLWLGADPRKAATRPSDMLGRRLTALHQHLWALSTGPDDAPDWRSRLHVAQAMRRVVMKTSALVRILPPRADREEAGWGELLVEAFHAPLPGQRESMADRVTVFLEDLRSASGSVTDQRSLRSSLLDATRLRDRFVALVSGATSPDERDRLFTGFNTPLLPEVLVCTSVGQEGIDLHRHCRHVVHYDLAWNPAVLEQRTGRADRIGSKTFRERVDTRGRGGPFLEIGVPFLAGTYDERMFEELRLRAQTFEVLTGGDLAIDPAEGGDDQGTESDLQYVPLPDDLVNELRVRLDVWRG